MEGTTGQPDPRNAYVEGRALPLAGGASGRYDRLKDTAFEYAWLLGQVGITK
ncbi:MAG: hypothetical protein ABSC08_05450 [Bryobacteraceae bacterium]|jgi:hypothetical protein